MSIQWVSTSTPRYDLLQEPSHCALPHGPPPKMVPASRSQLVGAFLITPATWAGPIERRSRPLVNRINRINCIKLHAMLATQPDTCCLLSLADGINPIYQSRECRSASLGYSCTAGCVFWKESGPLAWLLAKLYGTSCSSNILRLLWQLATAETRPLKWPPFGLVPYDSCLYELWSAR